MEVIYMQFLLQCKPVPSSPHICFSTYNEIQLQERCFWIHTSSPPQLVAIICAVSKARFKSEEYTAEMLGSLDSLSATLQEKKNK